MRAPSATMEVLPILEGIGRVAAAGVFMVAGATKLRIGPRSFARAILAYRLLPERLVAPSAYAIPVLELFLGAALLAGIFPLAKIAALANAGTLAAFVAVLLGLLWRVRPMMRMQK